MAQHNSESSTSLPREARFCVSDLFVGRVQACTLPTWWIGQDAGGVLGFINTDFFMISATNVKSTMHGAFSPAVSPVKGVSAAGAPGAEIATMTADCWHQL